MQRLRQLLQRWRAEEQVLAALLAELQTDRDAAHREVAWRRMIGIAPDPRLLERGSQLQQEHDEVGLELAHVRLAVAGAATELELLGMRPLLAS